MRRILTITCMLAGPWAAAGGPAAEPDMPDQIELRLKYRPGHVTRQRVVNKAVGSMKLFGLLPEQKFSQTFEQDLTIRCRSVNADGTAVVEMTMDRIAMKMSIFGSNVEFDTASPATRAAEPPGTDVVRKMFSAMAGSKLTMTIGPDGRPTNVEGAREMLKKMFDQLDDGNVPGFVRKMYDQLINLFGDDNVMQDMQQYNRMIPDKGPVRVGDKWDRKWEMKIPVFNGKVEGEGQYELLAIEEFHGRRCAKIGIKESFRMGGSPPPESESETTTAPAKGIFERMTFELKGSGGEGTAYWDYESGDLVQLRQTQRMTMEISLAADPNAETEEMKKAFGKMVQKLNTSLNLDLLDDAGVPVASPSEKSATATITDEP